MESNDNVVNLGRVVEHITWVDSAGGHVWETISEARAYKPKMINSVGFVISENEEYVAIVQSIDEAVDDDHLTMVAGNMTIPKVAIKSRKEVVRIQTNG